jgi:hypothetical protein
MYLSQLEANRRYQERQLRGSQNVKTARAEINRRLRDNPTPSDISRGDALNVALDEIRDPRVYLRDLKMTRTKVAGALIRDIPFQYAAAAITTSVEQVVRGGPPAVLKTDAFASEREALKKLGAEIRAQNEEQGQPDPATLKEARDILVGLRGKVEATIPRNTRERREAETYLKALYGLMRMLETPAIDVLLAGVEKRPDTTLGDLVGFMEAFNLRFGVASTPRQREVYTTLYPMLVAMRDEAAEAVKVSAAPAPTAVPTPPAPPSEIFEPLELDKLDPTKNPTAPK